MSLADTDISAPSTAALRADFFAFRVPALPMALLADWAQGVESPASPPSELAGALERDRALLRRRLGEIVNRPEVTRALALASPALSEALGRHENDPGLEASLVRYVSRMASRPTPFGLFAACGVGRVAQRTRLALPDPTRWRSHSRLDGEHLDRIIRERSGELRARLTFYPNDSLYSIGGRRRFVQTRLDGLERSHHLTELDDSLHLSRALEAARAGARPAQITEAVAAGGVERERAAGYVDELIEAQVLVQALAVTLTGSPPIDALIDDLETVGDDGTVAVLRAVRDELAAIDAGGATVPAQRHAGVSALLGELGVCEGAPTSLQVDARVPDCGATLSRTTVDDVIRGVELLRRIAPAAQPTDLDRFREAFLERYEAREVPLLEALDDDLGVGYGVINDLAPLLDGLPRPTRERPARFGAREQQLLALLHRAWAHGADEVVLGHDDIARLESDAPPALPNALAAMASLARTPDGARVLLSVAAGPAGASLLGRFCHADPVLDAHVRSHLRAEEAHAPDAIHAEVVHLPAGRMSNILVRPVLREWELEWLGRSGAPSPRRLAASDLLISLRGGRFVLRSARLGLRVLPRLASAHNWSRRSPAVYRFLCDVQSDGCVGSLSWSWSPLERVAFTPRVRWGRLIFARARWWVDRAELRGLAASDPLERWRVVQAWRARRRLPRWVCLLDGDNKLLIDFDNALSVDAFARAVRTRDEALLEELFPDSEGLVAEAPDGRRAIELVIPLARPTAGKADRAPDRPAAPRAPERQPVRAAIRRTFPPGSEWTYLKLYSGSATADSLLRTEIAELARALMRSGAADRWFFIRYADPRPHLRLRFHGDHEAIRDPLHEFVADVLETERAHDAQLGTYQREVERYGGPDAIAVAERLFHVDSEATVDLLGRFEPGSVGHGERWRIGVLGSYTLMRDLGLGEHECATAAAHLERSREVDLRVDSRLRRAIAARVRAEAGAIEVLLAADEYADRPLAAGIAALAARTARTRPLADELAALSAAGRLDLPLTTLVASYVHMWLNRLCRSENVFHEYVICALLARVLAARLASVPSRR